MTPRSPTAQTRPTRPLPLYVLLAALIFQGLSGVGGGIGLLSDPTGEALGIPLVWLEGSPFTDYSVPGVVLLTLLGVGPLLAAWGVWRRVAWSRGAAGVVGLALLVWLLVEIAVIGWQPQPPLQAIYGVVGIAIVGTALLPSVREHLRPRLGRPG